MNYKIQIILNQIYKLIISSLIVAVTLFCVSAIVIPLYYLASKSILSLNILILIIFLLFLVYLLVGYYKSAVKRISFTIILSLLLTSIPFFFLSTGKILSFIISLISVFMAVIYLIVAAIITMNIKDSLTKRGKFEN